MTRFLLVVVLGASTVILGGCSGGGGGNNGSQISFASAAFFVNEDGATIMEITLTRSGDFSTDVSATIFPTDGTATGGVPPLAPPADYDNTPIVVTWLAGDLTDKMTFVLVLDDHQDEPDETVNLSLGNFTGGAVAGATPNATLTITDNDVAGRFQFSQSSYSYGEDGTPFSAVTLQRVGGMDGDISCHIVSTDGTANSDPLSPVEPVDYTPIDFNVTFLDTVTTDLVLVLPGIVQDLLPESDETFTLTIVSTTGGATIGSPSTATVTISDDDTMLEIPNPNPQPGALFGSSVAKVGPRLAIGSPGAESGQGIVRFFDPSVPMETTSFNEPFSTGFGTKLVVDGTTLAVGALANIWVYTSDGFSHSFRFLRTNPQNGFGSTGLGLTDGRLVVGAPLAVLSGLQAGQVFVYDAFTGSLLQTIDGIGNSHFGSSFTFFQGNLVIGAPGGDGFVQTWAGDPLATTFTLANPAPNPMSPSPDFGAAVGSLGMDLIVGAPDEDLFVMNNGVLYFFDGGPPNAILAPGGFVADGRFGAQVFVMNNRICVQQQGGGTSVCGKVFVLDFQGFLVQTIDDPVPSANADFGASMCEYDGALVIAAPKQGAVLEPGSVFIFKLL